MTISRIVLLEANVRDSELFMLFDVQLTQSLLVLQRHIRFRGFWNAVLGTENAVG